MDQSEIDEIMSYLKGEGFPARLVDGPPMLVEIISESAPSIVIKKRSYITTVDESLIRAMLLQWSSRFTRTWII